jgi:cell division protein FtsQ
MDGGGRVVEPLTAGFPGVAAGRPEPSTGPARTRSFRPSLHRLPFLRRKRRSSFVAVPLARRLPRLTGTALLVAFFGATGFYGLVLGGQYDAMRLHHGEPRDVAARIAGFGLGKVTIAGIVQLSEREVLTMAGIHRNLSLPFLSVAEIRSRLESVPLIKARLSASSTRTNSRSRSSSASPMRCGSSTASCRWWPPTAPSSIA